MTRSRKIEPAVKTMVFNYAVDTDTFDSKTIDISQCASLLNRRFYRQGINWAVGSIKILSVGSQIGNIAISKLPETWVMSNAWEKAYHAYRKMNSEALEESESLRPRFEDFKIYADTIHHTAGYVANLLPTYDVLTAVPAVPGEWESSKIAQPVTGPAATDPGEVFEREILAVGASYPGTSPATGYNAVSLIEGYANSRALPSIRDPNLPDDGQDTDGGSPENWLGSLFNEGTQQSSEVLGVLTTENNQAPYPFENDGVHLDTMYPNGEAQLTGLQIHDLDTITGTTVGGITRLKGGLFPCGLVRVDIKNTSTELQMGVSVIIDLVPGTHRGYLCQPMQDM
jgi:hypothetical protein